MSTEETYDAAGRPTAEIDPLLQRTTFAYDDADRQTVKTNARSQRTTMQYDDDGRLIGQRFGDDTRATYAYDATGNRTLMRDGSGRYTYSYDERNALLTATNPANKEVTYTHDALGRRAVMTDPDGGRTTYGYDAKDREVWQNNPLDQRTTFSYDAADRTTELYVANGARTSYVYDAGDRLTALANLTSAGTIISSFTYTYDKIGNRTSVAEADGARTTWTYGKTYQLTNEHRSDVLGWESLTVDQWGAMSVDDWDKMEVAGAGAIFNTTYTYDPVGNRLVMEDSAALTTYTYNAANELLTAESSPGVTTYTYDGDGNRLTKEHPADGASTYAWDTQNRLLSVHDPVAGRFTFAYNADGQRVEREAPSQHRKFVYDARKPLLETTAANLTTLTYDYSNRDAYGELIARRQHDDETSFHQNDALGSTESLLDALEAVTDRYAYRAFGKIESQTGDTQNRQTFVGKFGYFTEEDLGLYFLNARYYDLATGRFISVDPMGFDAGDMNLYRYVKNKPLHGADPTGTVLYVVDGTSQTKAQNTNAHQLMLWYLRRVGGPERYWPGPATQKQVIPGAPIRAALGVDAPVLVRKVWQKVCDDYCAARSRCQNLTIDFAGYSRGAAIVATVARNLHISGCNCRDPHYGWIPDPCGGMMYRRTGHWTCVNYRRIPVRWVALFDAVLMMAPLIADTPGGWAREFSGNVGWGSHAIHTARNWREEKVFRTEMGFRTKTSGVPTPFYYSDGSPTTHGDLGHDPAPLYWMFRQAQRAGVIRVLDIMELSPPRPSRP